MTISGNDKSDESIRLTFQAEYFLSLGTISLIRIIDGINGTIF
jgi:hypothetical protein